MAYDYTGDGFYSDGGSTYTPRKRHQIVISEKAWMFMKTVMNAALKGRIGGNIRKRRKSRHYF